jgi:hypothetical protein
MSLTHEILVRFLDPEIFFGFSFGFLFCNLGLLNESWRRRALEMAVLFVEEKRDGRVSVVTVLLKRLFGPSLFNAAKCGS